MKNYKPLDEYRAFDHGLSYVPGVSDLNAWTLRAMMRPHSWNGGSWWHFYNETVEMIKEFMHTDATLIPFPGIGRIVIDATVNNFLEVGDKLLMIDNGYWARYPEVMTRSYGFEIVPCVFPSNRPIDPEKLQERLWEMDGPTKKGIKVVHALHVETESSILHPIRKISEVVHRMLPDALFIVDSATGFPGNKMEMDEWGIDVDYFVSHKGFNAPSGLTFMAVNERAMKAFERRTTPPRGWYTSIQTWKDIWLEPELEGRHCIPGFPNVILYAMRAKLDLMYEMGEEKYLQKYRLASKAIRMGLRKITSPENLMLVPGPRCEGCPGCEANDPNESLNGVGRFCPQTTVSLCYPEGTDWKTASRLLGDRYWISCPHSGFGDDRKDGFFYAQNGMRVGTINDRQHYPHNILAMISALGLSLRGAGADQVRLENGLDAVNTVLEEMESDLDWNYQEEY